MRKLKYHSDRSFFMDEIKSNTKEVEILRKKIRNSDNDIEIRNLENSLILALKKYDLAKKIISIMKIIDCIKMDDIEKNNIIEEFNNDIYNRFLGENIPGMENDYYEYVNDIYNELFNQVFIKNFDIKFKVFLLKKYKDLLLKTIEEFFAFDTPNILPIYNELIYTSSYNKNYVYEDEELKSKHNFIIN